MIVSHPHLIDDLVEFSDFNAIQSLSNYAGDIDPARVTLVKPIGVYRFREKIPCGLKNCHTPHLKGLVVLTSEGTAVNIGNICGRNHFGDQFAVLMQMAVRFEQRRFHISKVRELKSVAARYQAEMDALMNSEMGAAWCNRALRRLSDVLPSEALDALKDMARRGESSVYEETTIKGEEAWLTRQLGARSSQGLTSSETVRRDYKGQLGGLVVWSEDPGRSLYLLQQELNDFLKIDPINCRSKELRRAADFAATIASRIMRVKEQLTAGLRFFTPETFSRLKYLPGIRASSRQVLESLDWDFETGKPRGSRAA